MPRADRIGIQVHWSDSNPYGAVLPVVLVGMVLAAVLAVAGLPPVSIHEPLHFVGIMDPFCGMTRAARDLARGDLSGAWEYNPASYALALVAVGVVVISVVGRMTRSWVVVSFTRPNVVRVVAVALFALLWVNQQLHASLLA